MEPFHTINVSEMCGEVVLSQGVILLDQSAVAAVIAPALAAQWRQFKYEAEREEKRG